MVKLGAPGKEGQPLGMETQGPNKQEVMVMPSPVINALVKDQVVPCLIDTGSEVTVMEY